MPTDDLFAGTAWYYARYRVAYPPELFAHIADAFGLDGCGRLLDLGCGTGQLTIPLSRCFEQTIGLDPSAEMLQEARRQAGQGGATSIRWLELPAEQISPALGEFRLITAGGSFHWMERDEVLRRAAAMLIPDGGIALLGNGGSVWSGSDDWQQAIVQVIKRWLGPQRRAGADVYRQEQPRHEAILARSSFTVFDQGDYSVVYEWDIPSLIGLLYSTSFCSRSLLGANAAAFEADLTRTLLALNPTARFRQSIAFDHILARRTWPDTREPR